MVSQSKLNDRNLSRTQNDAETLYYNITLCTVYYDQMKKCLCVCVCLDACFFCHRSDAFFSVMKLILDKVFTVIIDYCDIDNESSRYTQFTFTGRTDVASSVEDLQQVSHGRI